MKTLYIHIGTPKTATTSIQYFCNENQEELKRRGYCYPVLPYKFNRINILRNAHFLLGEYWPEHPEGKAEEDERIFAEGMQKICGLFDEYDHVILSDEGLWNGTFRHRPDLWERLQKIASENGFAIRVIVYFRRQDALAASWWNQQVKIGFRRYSSLTWEEFIHQDPPILKLDYYEGISYIASFVGKENITVRRFDRKCLKNQSIYEDFLETIGISFDSRFVLPQEERNQGLYGDTHEIKRILNGIPNMSGTQNVFFRRILLGLSERTKDTAPRSMFSAEERKEFMDRYRPGNQKLMEEYIHEEGECFELDAEEKEKWTLDHTRMEKSIIAFFGKVAMELRDQDKEMRIRMTAMERELEAQREMIRKLQEEIEKPHRRKLLR